MKPEILRELCDRAMAEEMGIAIDCTNPHSVSLKLHDVLKNFEGLTVCVPSTPDTVFIIKKTVSLHNLEAPES